MCCNRHTAIESVSSFYEMLITFFRPSLFKMQEELVSHHLGFNEVLLKHRCVCVSAENTPLLCLSWGLAIVDSRNGKLS